MKFFSRCIFIIAFLVVAPSAFAATINVTTAGTVNPGDGLCSFEEAVNNANANSDTSGGDCINAGEALPTIDEIHFQIPGVGPHTISLNQQLSITEAVVIDGTTQAGTVCQLEGGNRALQINLDGAGLSYGTSLFYIQQGADNVTIKGLAIYNARYGSGVVTWANSTTVQCNNIGTDAVGLVSYPNQQGISVYDSGVPTSGHVFGGPNSGDGNLVSGNNVADSGSNFDGMGIACGADDILIQGNWVGVDITGQSVLPNKSSGITCGNGGGSPYDNIQILDNVVSGNGTTGNLNFSAGIAFGGSENAGTNGVISNAVIKGNIVGLSADGLVDMGNEDDGIYVGASASGVIIGGVDVSDRNITSGNGGNGITVGYDVQNVQILGNFIGLDGTGLATIGNDQNGISFSPPNLNGGGVVTNITIGGSATGSANVIAGSQFDVIYMGGVLSDISIVGNFIGTNSTGEVCIGGSAHGINASGGSVTGLVIGGDTAAHGNVIGCNTSSAILVDTPNAVIKNNFLGVSKTGANIAEYDGDTQGVGVELNPLATDSVIEDNSIGNNTIGIKGYATGGVVSMTGNTITNSVIGISIISSTSVNPTVTLSRNIITDSQVMAIDLARDTDNDRNADIDVGVTNSNDVFDTDEGPNGYLNTPVILMTMQDGADTRVLYGLDVPLGTYQIEFFSNPTVGVHPSGYGEGEEYIESVMVTKTTLGFETMNTTLANVSISDDITATVTQCDDALCNNLLGTSEFSNTAPPGVDYDTTDYTASHVLSTAYLGACVNGDAGSNSNTDSDGPVQTGAYLGTGPCTDDRDGVKFVEPGTSVGPSSYQINYEPGETGIPNDATFSGTYIGPQGTIYLIIAATAPDNGDDADYFVWTLDGQTLSDPAKITPGIPQSIVNGLYVTFANATGHSAFDFGEGEGQVWAIEVSPSTVIPSTTERTGPYEYGEEIPLSIQASAAGYVHVWVDVNQDGDFTDADEWMVRNEYVGAGLNAVSAYAPSQAGTYTLRVRYQTVSNDDLLPTGSASDGEVEDYQFVVKAPTPVVINGTTGSIGYLPRLSFAPVTKSSSVSSSSAPSVESILGSGTCPAELTIKDLMKQGDRNGKYGAYNKKIVNDVKILQAHINRILAAQYNQAAGPVDGIFGKLTKQGVQRLQSALNAVLKPNPLLKIDGVVGPFTRNAINNSCGK